MATPSTTSSPLEREKAAARLDHFLSVLYLYPNCLDVDDVELLAQRERELSNIYKMAGRAFFCTYVFGVAAYFGMRKGTMPYFKDIMMQGTLCVAGSFLAANMAEKVSAEMFYNRVMFQMADKYNFTAEEVMDLQRNLNQYYIQKDREADMKR